MGDDEAKKVWAPRTSGALFLLGGAINLLDLVLPGSSPEQRAANLLVSFVAIVSGLVIWSLPWTRWPYRRTTWLIPYALYVVMLKNVAGTPPHVFANYFVLVFVWIGLWKGQWTSLAWMPLTVAAYVLPIVWTDGGAAAVASTAFVVPTWVVVGETLAWVSTRFRDSESRRLSERASHESRYRVLFQSNPHPMWVYDVTTLRFLAVNDAAVRHYGYSRAEFMAMSLEDIRPPEDVQRLHEVIEAHLATEDVVGEWRHRKKDGTVFDVEVRAHSLVFGDRPARLVLATDITERKAADRALRAGYEREREAAQELRRVDEMKNAFLSAVSHELRTPLTSVIGYADTLQRWHADLPQEERAPLIERLAVNARKLESLLLDLLDVDRMTRGILKPNLRNTELGELVRKVVEHGEVGSRRVHVDVTAMVMKVDAPKVERIVENLVANAARHTPATAEIWVRLRRVSEGALLIVEDSGRGVPAGLQGSIFDPFQQGPVRVEHAPGVGIGLTLVRRFAELHGGRAWVTDRPGGGASFQVLLPEPGAHAPGSAA